MFAVGSTISFTEYPLDQALHGVAALGFEAVDLLIFHGWAHIDPVDLLGKETEQADGVARMLDAVGLHAAALNAKQTYVMNTPDEAEQAQNLKEHVALGKFARALGAQRITLQPGPMDAHEDAERSLELSIEAFRRCVEAIGGEVMVSFEPHCHSVAESYPAMQQYLDAVPGLYACYDPSHFVTMGWDLAESAFLFERTGNVHLRDAGKDQLVLPWGEGEVDLAWVLDGLKASGYGGSMSIEYFPREGENCLPSVRALHQAINRHLA